MARRRAPFKIPKWDVPEEIIEKAKQELSRYRLKKYVTWRDEVKFLKRFRDKVLSIGDLYMEYEDLVDFPVGLEAFWTAMIKILKPIRVWSFSTIRDVVVLTERDYFFIAKWEDFLNKRNLETEIKAKGIPVDLNLLPRIYRFNGNKWGKVEMWWEKSLKSSGYTILKLPVPSGSGL